MNFYVYDGDQMTGPLPMSEIARRWREGLISEDAQYTPEGSEDWSPLMNSEEMARFHPVVKEPFNVEKFIGLLLQLLVFGGFLWIVVSCQLNRSDRESRPRRSVSTSARAEVENSAWDGSVSQVKRYIERNAKDPKSVDYIDWSKVSRQGSGYVVRVKYRAKNSFGGFVVEEKIFVLDADGEVVEAVGKGE